MNCSNCIQHFCLRYIKEEVTDSSDYYAENLIGPSAGYDSETSDAREKKRLRKIKSDAKLKKK